MTTAAVVIGWLQIGPSILSGVVVMALMLPLQLGFGKMFASARRETAKRSDARTNAVKDMIRGMRAVKMASWEGPLADNIGRLRATELRQVSIAAQLKGFKLSFFFGVVTICSYASLATYVASGGTLTAAKAFTVVSLFGAIRLVIGLMLPACIQYVAEVRVTFERIQTVLDLAPIQATRHAHTPHGDQAASKKEAPAGTGTSTAPIPCGPGSVAEAAEVVEVPGAVCSVVEVCDAVCGWEADRAHTDGVAGAPEAATDGGACAGVDEGAGAGKLALDAHGGGGGGTDGMGGTGGLLNLDIGPGEVAAVMGPVGSGKSTLLLSILGELRLREGTLRTTTPVLFCPQEPWIFQASVRANITFVYQFDAAWYDAVLDGCALRVDLDGFEFGDQTEIGERGITLSGGQRARVALARTLYATKFASENAGGVCCLVALDDPFSAVDAKTARVIYEDGIKKLLARHSVILVTHHAKFAREADHLLVLNRDGTPDTSAQASDLEPDADLDLGAGLDAGLGVGAGAEVAPKATPSAAVGGSAAIVDYGASTAALVSSAGLRNRGTGGGGAEVGKGGGVRKLAKMEAKEKGAVSATIYMRYLRAARSWVLVAVAFALIIGAQVAQIMCDWYLAEWSKSSSEEQEADRAENQQIYASLLCGFLLILFVRSSVYMVMAIRASQRLHDSALSAVIAGAMRFFDTQPMGRILNRFTKDLGYLDELLPDTCLDFLQLSVLCFTSTALVCVVEPLLLLAAIPLFAVFAYVRQYYMRTGLQIKRIEGTARSPLYAHLSDTIEGLTTIHAFPGAAEWYTAKFERFQNDHTRAWFAFICTSRWLGSRLDMIVVVMMTVTAFTSVHLRDQTPAGSIGLALAYLMQLTGVFQWAVRQSAEVENQLTSCERLLEYGKLKTETDVIACGRMGPCASATCASKAAGHHGKGGHGGKHHGQHGGKRGGHGGGAQGQGLGPGQGGKGGKGTVRQGMARV